jgi:hypothetical protein
MKARIRLIYTILLALLPLQAIASRLTSVDCSTHPKGNFCILVLHFDETTAYRVTDLEGGRASIVSSSQCDISPEATAKLKAVSNDLISGVIVAQEDGGIKVQLNFTENSVLRVHQANDPFSLILDVSTGSKKAEASKVESVKEEKKPGAEPKKEAKSGGKSEGKSEKSEGSTKSKGESGSHTNSPDVSSLSSQGHFDRGLALVKEKKYSEALPHFEQARKESTLFAKATAEIASIYREQGKTSEAIAEWEKFFTVVDKPGNHDADLLPSHEITTPTIVPKHEPPAEKTTGASQASEPSPKKNLPPVVETHDSHLWIYFLYVIVAGLLGMTIHFYRANRQLNQKVLLLLQDDEAEDPPPPKARPKIVLPPSDDDLLERMQPQKPVEPEPSEATPDFLLEDEPPSKVALPEPEVDTSQEVYSLAMKGFSIQDIAERMGLGQDEVRLVLNLQRDEESAPNTKK